jgi:predicted glycosyltransferase
VDTFPDDVEVISMLCRLKSAAPPRAILRLRDIVADAPVIQDAWNRDGAYQALDDLYDRIVVFGCQHLYEVIQRPGDHAGR